MICGAYGPFVSSNSLVRLLSVILASVFLFALTAEQSQAQFFGGASKKDLAKLQRRMARIEKQNRMLTGQVEQLTHHVRELNKQMRQMQEDFEIRLRAAKKGGSGKKSSLIERGDGGASKKRTAYRTATAASETAGSGTTTDAETSALGAAIGRPLDLSAVAGEPARGKDDEEDEPERVAKAPASPREAYNQAYDAFLTGEYKRAERRFRRFIKDHPDHRLASNALFWVGESLLARRKFNEAGNEFLKYYETYPKTRRAPDSLLKLGHILIKLDKADIACKVLGELADNYPNSPRTILRQAKAAQKKAKC